MPAVFEAEPADAAPDLTEVRSARRAAPLAALEHERERDAYIADGAGGFRTDEASEALVKRLRVAASTALPKKATMHQKDIDTLNLEKTLSYQTKFKITIDQEACKKGGKLIFSYNDFDELDRICKFLQNMS